MLAFKNRFHGHGSLRYVYQNGRSVRSHLMTIKSTHHPKRQEPRVAVVISKKVLKSAVGRNRVRRRIYEIVRHELPKLKANSDIVIIVFAAEAFAMPHPELQKTVVTMLKSSDLYQK